MITQLDRPSTLTSHLSPSPPLKSGWLDKDDPSGSLKRLIAMCDEDVDAIKEERALISPGYFQETAYVRAIDDLRWFLRAFTHYLESAEVQDVELVGEVHIPSDLQVQLLADPDEAVRSRLTSLWEGFEHAAAELARANDCGCPDLSLERRKAYGRSAQRELSYYLDQSPFVKCSRTPPSGKAGDTLVVRMILGERLVAPTLLGNFLDTWHLETSVSQAHRNRIQILEAWYQKQLELLGEEERVRVLNLGCGPAREVVSFLRRNSGNLKVERFSLLLQDYSVGALAEAEAAIRESARIGGTALDLQTEKVNAFKLAALYNRPVLPERRGEFEMVYCAGLYDYLKNEVADAVTRGLYHHLAPEGMLLITNVDSVNPNKWAQELLLNWPLIYRDRKEMERLANALKDKAPEVGLRFSGDLRSDIRTAEEVFGEDPLAPGEYCVTADPTGVNLFLWIRADREGALMEDH